jgi:hypothetical protein
VSLRKGEPPAIQSIWTIGSEPKTTNENRQPTVLQIRGISIIYDEKGQFLGYSDDEEDIARAKAEGEKVHKLSLQQQIDLKVQFWTDVPWKDPPFTQYEFWHSPDTERIQKQFDEWNAWLKQRYYPYRGELRPAPNGARRTIFSSRPDHIHDKHWCLSEEGIRESIRKRKLQDKLSLEASSQDHDRNPPPPDAGTETGQSSTQESKSVESQYSQSSEGQLRKPTKVVKVDVTATFLHLHDEVNARSDDLLALKAENQLEFDLSGKSEVKPCLKEDLRPDFQVRKSTDHPNCSLARPVNPGPPPDSPTLLQYQAREREMRVIEHFLDRDLIHFGNLAPNLRRLKSRKEREDWMHAFFQKAYKGHDFRGDESLFNERCYQAAHYVTLYEQAMTDDQGRLEDSRDYSRKALKIDLASKSWVSRPFNMSLGQCERTFGPSHVVEGGGDALEPASLCCEKPSGPSRYTGDATQRSSDLGMDRSSPLQDLGARAGSDRHNVGTDPEGFP